MVSVQYCFWLLLLHCVVGYSDVLYEPSFREHIMVSLWLCNTVSGLCYFSVWLGVSVVMQYCYLADVTSACG